MLRTCSLLAYACSALCQCQARSNERKGLPAAQWVSAYKDMAMTADACEVRLIAAGLRLLRCGWCTFLCQVWKYSSSYAHMRTCLEIAVTKSWAVAQSYDETCRRDWHARAKRGELRAACYVALCLVGVVCSSAGGHSFDVNVASMTKDQTVFDRVINALGSSAGARDHGPTDSGNSGKQGAISIALVANSPPVILHVSFLPGDAEGAGGGDKPQGAPKQHHRRGSALSLCASASCLAIWHALVLQGAGGQSQHQSQQHGGGGRHSFAKGRRNNNKRKGRGKGGGQGKGRKASWDPYEDAPAKRGRKAEYADVDSEIARLRKSFGK